MRFQLYNNFWQQIHESAKESGFPLRVMFELTYRCNFKCKHCYVPQSYRKKGELNTKEVFSLLDQLKDIGCFYLGFTGGEPFMRKDIMKILWYAKKCGFEVIIYTNGSLINERTAQELVRLRPNKVDITIPAMSKKPFERISGVRGAREKVFGAIDFLHKERVDLGFKTCVLKENEAEISQIEDFVHSLGALHPNGAKHRLDDMLSPRLDGSKEPFKYRPQVATGRRLPTICPKAVNDNLLDCDTKIINYQLSTINLFKCGVGVSQAAITPLGELKMCLMIDYPKYRVLLNANRRKSNANLRECAILDNRTQIMNNREQRIENKVNGISLREAWERLKKLVRNIKPDESYQCDKCDLEPYCKWCPAKAWLDNRTFTICDSESKHRAEIRRSNTQHASRRTLKRV
ncbi:MAG: radical SAM protein [Candidatus Omnitrophica bacterium]|nr:radical SAM protein [Candidatus Omnitrophota bacterium]